MYRYLVDNLIATIYKCQFTPSELREMAVLASIIYEEQRLNPRNLIIPKDIELSLTKVHEWLNKNA